METLSHRFQKLANLVRNSERILLISHKKPDGDTIGSTTAFYQWLLTEGKQPKLFCVDQPAPTFQYITNIHHYTSDASIFDGKYDVVISFDSSDLIYSGAHELLPRLKPGYVFVNIDHHRTNASYADLNIISTELSSTSEVMYAFFVENNISIHEGMATSLLTGICTDTSNFSNPLTSNTSLAAASHLVKQGARFADILKYFWQHKNLSSLTFWGTVMSRLHLNPTYNIATTYAFAHEIEALGTDAPDDRLINFMAATLQEADVILFLKEMPGGKIRGSFRGHRSDVSAMAKILGGGGHKGAAGFTVDGKLVETEEGVRIV